MDGTIDIDDPGNLALMLEAMVELLRELAKRLGADDA